MQRAVETGRIAKDSLLDKQLLKNHTAEHAHSKERIMTGFKGDPEFPDGILGWNRAVYRKDSIYISMGAR